MVTILAAIPTAILAVLLEGGAVPVPPRRGRGQRGAALELGAGQLQRQRTHAVGVPEMRRHSLLIHLSRLAAGEPRLGPLPLCGAGGGVDGAVTISAGSSVLAERERGMDQLVVAPELGEQDPGPVPRLSRQAAGSLSAPADRLQAS